MNILKSSLFLLVFLIVSCSSGQVCKVGITNNELTNTGWQLKIINGVEAEPESYMKGLPTLYFAEDGNLSGITGCNHFMGGYKIDDKNLYLTAGAMSKMACPGTGEAEFLNLLSQTVAGVIQAEELHLKDESGKDLMIFRQIKFPIKE